MKVGIAVNNLGANQLSYYILRQVNDNIYYDTNVMLFYSILHKPCLIPKVGVMHVSEMWGYDGIIIATDLNSAAQAIKSPGPSKRYFYVWDLEWKNGGPYPYHYLSSIYSNPKLNIIARSESHANIIANCWNRTSYICDNCNIKELEKIIDER